MTGADHQTYREVPFAVPAGTTRLTVAFDYTGRDQKAVIDIGVRDPVRFRGWSGGAKARFTISDAEATPSYLPGPIPAGTWKLVLGVPNLRKDGQARYTARVWFERGAAFAGFAAAPLKTGDGWWRGDLHLHTGHSDGSCASHAGQRVPCPVFRTAEAAVARGLDFIAVTDHNATSQSEMLRELQPYFDDLLLIPGREVTTFQGHANVLGPTGPLDFQLGSPRAPEVAAIQAEAEKAGGLFSINHPALPSGETCMGCGWTARDTDFARVPAIEVVNGGALAQARGGDLFSGVPFWEARLNAGFRITAVGGSDNHDPTVDVARLGAVGSPTTVVHAPELSQPAILAAIRAGHVFVDLTGGRDKRLEVTARLGAQVAEMGDAIAAPPGASLTLEAHVLGAADGLVRVIEDSRIVAERRLSSADETPVFNLLGDGARHWLRVEIRGPDGKLWLLGNPVYLNPSR